MQHVVKRAFIFDICFGKAIPRLLNNAVIHGQILKEADSCSNGSIKFKLTVD